MRYPKLVRQRDCKTDISVTIQQEGLSEDGGTLEAFSAALMCNYQDRAETFTTKDKKEVKITGKALFANDFCPEVLTISGGTVVVHGEKRSIAYGIKARNPDGTVNHVELGLE